MEEISTPFAARYNENKPQVSLILDASDALYGATEVLAFGAKKYSRCNFLKGFPYTELVDSMLRHIISFHKGEDIDSESALPHVDHILCNALFLSQTYHQGNAKDDRHKEEEV